MPTVITGIPSKSQVGASFSASLTGGPGTGTWTYQNLTTLTTSTGTLSALGAGTITSSLTVPGSNSIQISISPTSEIFSYTIIGYNTLLEVSTPVPNVALVIDQDIDGSLIPVQGVGGDGVLVYSDSPNLASAGLNLDLDSSNGAVIDFPLTSSGPTAFLASTPYTVTVIDGSGQTTSSVFNLSIGPAALSASAVVTNRPLALSEPAIPFTPVVGSGGYGTLTYSVSPSMPTGLSFNTANGEISGTPTVYSTTTVYTVTVTDSTPVSGGGAQTAFATFTMSASGPGLDTTLVIPSVTLIENSAAVPFQPVVASGGAGSITYLVSPSLPLGLSLASGTGIISGTPLLTSSTSTYTITAQDSVNQISAKSFFLNVTISPANLTSTGTIAEAFDYNTIQETVYEIIGLGEDGYGIPTAWSGPVTNRNRMTAIQWNIIQRDINSIYVHITNTLTGFINVVTGTTIVNADLPNILYSKMPYALANRFVCHPEQYFADPTTGERWNTTEGTSTRVTTWGFGSQTEITHIVSATWPTRLTTRYFFNQGGYFKWRPFHQNTATNGGVLTDIDTEWANFISHVQGLGGWEYRRDEYVTYNSTVTTWTSGTLQMSVAAEKSGIPDSNGQTENQINFTIKYTQTDNPDLVVVPSAVTWNIVI